MTSRERIIASIEHKQPDALPLDLGATPSSGISAIAYHNLKEHIGFKTGHNRVFDVVQQVSIVEPKILDRYNIDVIDAGVVFNDLDTDWRNITLNTGQKVQFPSWFNYKVGEKSWDVYDADGDRIATMPELATFFDQTYFPYLDGYPDHFENFDKDKNKVLWHALAHSPWDHAAESGFWENFRKRVIKLRESTDRAIMLNAGCNLFEWGTFLRRIDNFMMDVYVDQPNVERLLNKLMEGHLATLDKVCEYLGDVVDVIRFGDDLGMDTGGFMSPDVYAKVFKPKHTMLNDYVKKHSNIKTFLHSCGSIHEVLPHLIEAGFDVINPVQTTARDMEPAKLKKEFGKDITFWGGGCNTRTVLNHETPDQVYSYTRRMIDTFFVDGGFVFNQEHNIMPDVPPENIEAMMKAVNEYK